MKISREAMSAEGVVSRGRWINKDEPDTRIVDGGRDWHIKETSEVLICVSLVKSEASLDAARLYM